MVVVAAAEEEEDMGRELGVEGAMSMVAVVGLTVAAAVGTVAAVATVSSQRPSTSKDTHVFDP